MHAQHTDWERMPCDRLFSWPRKKGKKIYVCIWGFSPGLREGLCPFDSLINITSPSAYPTLAPLSVRSTSGRLVP